MELSGFEPSPMDQYTDPNTGLTSYELERIPRTPITDDSTTTIQVRTLNVELTCAVCLGILHNTLTVMECLHRFCSGCITKSLRLGKKECPTCRVKCTSRRHLRPDPNFDAIISQIYPNLEEFEAKEETLIEQINKHAMQSGSLKDSVEVGKQRQALAKPSRAGVRRVSRQHPRSPQAHKPQETPSDLYS
eukprot:TRINITY_DN7534_c0_g1_i3.p1 TRINITY_DN7534_c0_g1~~TRINITY_DN7534_c0_g1_i3.p1  ORF type:complete len:190 (+),score=10.14 TRINITY_DN7534_c0_g1_i3:29-598(+)